MRGTSGFNSVLFLRQGEEVSETMICEVCGLPQDDHTVLEWACCEAHRRRTVERLIEATQ
jgi:hypothetical protein